MKRALIPVLLIALCIPALLAIGQDRSSGTMAGNCAKCHATEETGDQWSAWKASGHSRSFEVLGSEVAKAVMARAGLEGDPKQAESCLACHAPMADKRANEVSLRNIPHFEGSVSARGDNPCAIRAHRTSAHFGSVS